MSHCAMPALTLPQTRSSRTPIGNAKHDGTEPHSSDGSKSRRAAESAVTGWTAMRPPWGRRASKPARGWVCGRWLRPGRERSACPGMDLNKCVMRSLHEPLKMTLPVSAASGGSPRNLPLDDKSVPQSVCPRSLR